MAQRTTTLTSGTEIAGFRIESLLAEGGMGTVYLATQLRLDREVALKVLSIEHGGDPEFQERFIRESKLAASLDHPNVLPVYDAGEVDDVTYLAMRYVEGGDLRRLLRKHGRVGALLALDISRQMALALDAAHSAGLVHRDVKPANILLGGDDHAYLADFGLARRENTRGLTRTGVFMGTPDYAAPEQLEGIRAIDGRADVYSLGCVLYHCLAGQPPYVRESEIGVITAHLHDPVPQLGQVRPDLPPALGAVVGKAMEKDRSNRHFSAADMAAELGAVLTDLGGIGARGAPPSTEKTDTQPVEPAPSARVGRTKTVLDRIDARTPLPLETEERRRTRFQLTFAHMPRRRIWVGLASLAIIAAVIAGILAFATSGTKAVSGGRSLRVPSIVGMKEGGAETRLRNAHFEPSVLSGSSSRYSKGLIYRVSPRPGSKLPTGRVVRIWISTGNPTFRIPYVVGEGSKSAESKLTHADLQVKKKKVLSMTVRKGLVIRQEPLRHALVRPGQTVTIWLSNGKPRVSVPYVGNEYSSQAIRDLKSAGLRVDETFATTYDRTLDGRVASQAPTAGHRIDKGSIVKISVWRYSPPPPPAGGGGTTTRQTTTGFGR